jgi:hypothetical protein
MTSAVAQQVRSPSGGGIPIQSGVSAGPPVDIPQTNLTPITSPPAAGPSAIGYGSFDPYAINPSVGNGAGSGIPGISSGLGPGVTTIGPPAATSPMSPGAVSPFPQGGSLFGRVFSQPASSPIAPVYGPSTQGPVLNSSSIYGNPPPMSGGVADSFGTPGILGAQPGYSPPPAFPSTIYPSTTPSTLFPEGLFPGGISPGLYSNPGETYNAFRLLQGPRLRWGYVSPGKKPGHLGMNDMDTSLVFAFPNFLFMTQPIFVIPSFSLHLWDGPIGVIGADLPSRAYSGFIDIGWESDPNMMFSTEFGVRVGAFTDFDTFNSRSTRVLGRGLVSFRLTPTSTLKAGAYYLDRNNIKWVPAGGFLCRPNPFTRWDIFFPQPKFARYCRTIGTRDVWWYLAGDFGGGTWTIRRTDGSDDSIDINDYRAIFGIEWGTSEAIRVGRRRGFFEVGYVFSREVKYRYNPQDDFKPDDGIMFRAGIGY